MTTARRTAIRAGHIIAFDGRGHRLLRDGVVVIEGDTILHVGPRFEAAREREPAPSAASSEQAAFAGITAGTAKQEGAAAPRLELIGEDGTPVTALALPAAAPAPGSRLVVTVAGGAIATIEPEAADAVADPAVDGLIGRQLPGVADGRYVGVVVGREPSP